MSSEPSKSPYRVLARKYRPSNFDELIGHEAMVRTLSNALEAGRLAHAFILTGTRGIGKTTTARIIARGLNCTGADGTGGPTISPCGVCDNCRAIAEDRHQDVMEMDAASRTGVDDVRELIDGVRYLPVTARFKIYIIDEVHMLSKNAFNALLKTLEEPPEHVKFIFATTEIRKIPVTVLSRCQRFDLKRVDGETLAKYFATIAEKEQAKIDSDALSLIARAAEGSVRDGLSLLDQAIAHGDGTVSAEQVRDMLGLADRTQILDLLNLLMEGDIKAALALLRGQYDSGADPVVVMQDLLELTHWLTALKVTPEAANNVAMAGADVTRGQEMSGRLSMPVLARAWQMLLKGLDEVRGAPMPLAAAEMVLIRLAYVSELPSPEELAKKITSGEGAGRSGAPAGNGAAAPSAPVASSQSAPPRAMETSSPAPRTGGSGGARTATAMAYSEAPAAAREDAPKNHLSLVARNDALPEKTLEPEIAQEALKKPSMPQSLQDVANLLSERKDITLKGEVLNFMRLVAFEPGRIEFAPASGAAADLAARLSLRLKELTGQHWAITKNENVDGRATLAEQRESDRAAAIDAMEHHPMVQNIRALFPDASIREIRDLGPSLDMMPEDNISGEDDSDDGEDLV
ncbi:MAG: DNA polymerase III subunit gamma/tau [Alphaproteobacteria bacterium]|nr:MAG: DNA polymerase III subunit gamma/tau [Alphaproteobacteria bacterium]